MLWGVLSDIHRPYHNQRKLDLALDLFEDQGITGLLLGGDIADFYTINSYGPKHPDVQQTIESELIDLDEFLNYLRKRFKNIRIVFMQGNHEWRLDRYILKNCPSFYNYLTLDNHVDFEKLDIEHIEYNEKFQLADKLFFMHSPPSYSENHAATSFKKKFDEDFIFGCSHRPDMAIRKGSSGASYRVDMLGWFGEINHVKKMQHECPENRRVFSFTKNHDQWSCSFALVGVTDGLHSVQHIQVKENPDDNKYYCTVGNSLYTG